MGGDEVCLGEEMITEEKLKVLQKLHRNHKGCADRELFDTLEALWRVARAADVYLHTPIPIDLEPYKAENDLKEALAVLHETDGK